MMVFFKTLMTKDETGVEKKWFFLSPKKGGAHGAGQYGGFYQSGSDRCLIKQDSKMSLNIAEFLGGRIYQAINSEVSAVIDLVRVNPHDLISSDGRNVYVLSRFIPNWTHDLYTEIQSSLNRSLDHSRFRFKEIIEVAGRLMLYPDELVNFFNKSKENGHLSNFGEISATSLLINNLDMNLGNIGVLDKKDGKPKKLAIIDYAAAFNNLTSRINPHSLKKYLFTHTYHHEGWNNFVFYPEILKISPEFVFELDKAAAVDLTETVSKAFKDIALFYGMRPIIDFAVRAGVSERFSDRYVEALEQNQSLKTKKIKQIQDAIISILAQRQVDLLRFSAQIKIDLCAQYVPSSKTYHLDGSFIDFAGNRMTFDEVFFHHFDYFKEIILGEESFKFRQSEHKCQKNLIEAFHHKCRIITASFILHDDNKGVSLRHEISTMEDAMEVLKKGLLDKTELMHVLNKRLISEVKIYLARYQEKEKQLTFDLAKKIIITLNIPLEKDDSIWQRLIENVKLQEAIIQLDQKCSQWMMTFTEKEREALIVYKTKTIALALQSPQHFKSEYGTIEAQAIREIDKIHFVKLVRCVGNLFVLALATVLVVGLFGLYLTKEVRGGLLFFKGPERAFSSVAANIDQVLSMSE